MSLNCSDSAPSASEYFTGLKEYNQPILIITSICVILTIFSILLFGRHLYVINLYVSKASRRHCLKWIAFLFPFTTIAAGTAICIPRSIPAMQVFISLYFARVMFTFVELIRDLWGGRSELVASLNRQNQVISLSTPPLCCCCLFLPKLKPTWHNVKIVEWLTIQIAFIRPLITYAAVVGLSDMGGASPFRTQFQSFTNILNIISTVVAMWGLQILTGISRNPLKEFCVFSMFKMIQLVIICYNLQSAVFKLLANNGLIPCSTILPANTRAEVWHHLALVFEVFLISILTTYLCGARANAVFDKHPSRTESMKEKQGIDNLAAVQTAETQNNVNVIVIGN